MDTLTRFAQPWVDRAARIGADPRDDDDLRLRKALLVFVCVLILPISILWGAIYLALGVQAGLIAWLYTLISVGAIAVYSRTRDFEWLLRVELLDILLAPTVSMAFVGGFVASGGASWPRSGRSSSRVRAPGCVGSAPSWSRSWSPGSSVSWPVAAGRAFLFGSRAR
jgi:hypothetical protein